MSWLRSTSSNILKVIGSSPCDHRIQSRVLLLIPALNFCPGKFEPDSVQTFLLNLLPNTFLSSPGAEIRTRRLLSADFDSELYKTCWGQFDSRGKKLPSLISDLFMWETLVSNDTQFYKSVCFVCVFVCVFAVWMPEHLCVCTRHLLCQ